MNMQQYIALGLALVASFGLVLSASVEDGKSAPFVPSEQDNIAQLVGPQAKFTEYCQQARELVLLKVSNEKDRLKTVIFNVLMSSGKTLAEEVSTTMSSSVGQLGETLRDPSKPIEENEDADETQRKIIEAAKRIQDGSNKNDLLSSITTVVSVVLGKAKQVFFDQLAKAKILLKPDTILLVNDACTRLNGEYLAPLQSQFVASYKKIMKEAKEQNDANTMGFLAYFKQMGSLQCGVIKRLMNLKLFCSVFSPAVPVIQEMISSRKGNDMDEMEI